MKHHWIVEHHKDIFLSGFEADELLRESTVRVALNVDTTDWVLCDICGTLLRQDTLYEECPDRD